MGTLSLIILAFAVSIDGFAAGLAYGIKRIKIPVNSLLLISITSALAIWVSMSLGRIVAVIVTPNLAEIIGGIILVILGGWLVAQNINILNFKGDDNPPSNKLQEILSEPSKADFDGSGVISGKEALILGIALAMDAMAAGFGASLIGFHSLWTPLFVGACKLLLIPLGIKLGRELISVISNKVIVFLPGCILILLGIVNFVA
ncbi:sporulation membrane protein YtaF [Natranaerofaba carboxydovora]|uniref:sporulation membrane protein YtaF n=1 Tax=Natranaerofaba carboxydovora TaxID=2742683 RepID=UPI001F13A8FE|nr:sporulation membrane protein YtaF [Natranaerofaba carboxydovora]UMZ72563.1 Putative manganese efflux pump [Natranaerofaba carboxydovora]